MSGEQQAAFAAVYERHHRALLRYCRSIVGHDQDAQDALQSTMASALKALRNKPLDFDPQPWLFRIARNEAISILRRRRPTAELAVDLVQRDEVHARVEAHETLRLLQQDLADLPARQRSALLLRELHGLSSVQIAEILGTTPGAVNQLILEARRALSRCAEGRATPCYDVQRAFSDGDGRVTRARKVRAHLRSCPSCQRFRADIQRRPRNLAALGPTLPAALAGGGASAPVTAGVVAKVAVAVLVTATAATGVRELRQAHHAVPAPPPARSTVAPALDVAARGAPAVVLKPRNVARSGRPTAGALPRSGAPVAAAPVVRPRVRRETVARATPAVAPEPGSARPTTAPGQKAEPGGGRTPAPGQTKKQAPAAPPGQTKKGAAKKGPTVGGRTTAPGQPKKQAPKTPPGQAKKQAAAPPGQAKKQAAPPPGQAKKQAAPPLGQVKKQAAAPSGQAKTQAPAAPPGQSEKPAAPPSGQAKKQAASPPGQAKE